MSELATNDLIRKFQAARRAATPTMGIETPDQNATMSRLTPVLNGVPVIQWDLIRGVLYRNPEGKQMLVELGVSDPASFNDPATFLALCQTVPAKTVCFMLNSHRYFKDDSADVAQAVANLRDPFKSNRRMLVMLAPSFNLPAELQQDVLILDEPLPTPGELERVVTNIYTAAKLDAPDAITLDRAVDALRGLYFFPAEQATAMAITPKGLDLEDLRERKRKVIESMPGLSVWRNKADTLDKMGGLENAKSFFMRLFNGNGRPRVIVFWDEIEKAVGGADNPLDNVQKGYTGTILSHMENTKATGSIFLGVPGAGKSQLVKALGNWADVQVIVLDTPGMKGGLQGQSEQQLRQALKVIEAYGGVGGALWIATSNNDSTLPPELKSRFRLPTFFFDKPTDEEKQAIWPIYLNEFSIPEQQRPVDTNWTGREIRSCCENAWRLNCPLIEAATYVVPVAVAAREQIDRLRANASGRYISASTPGLFNHKGILAGADVNRQLAAD